MKKGMVKKLLGVIFLFVFFAKMTISVAPIVADHFDSNIINNVIMQLEIEHSSTKGAEQEKENSCKGEWVSDIKLYNFSLPLYYLCVKNGLSINEGHIQSFYPPVPTPPPSLS